MEVNIIIIGITCVMMLGFIGAECYYMNNVIPTTHGYTSF